MCPKDLGVGDWGIGTIGRLDDWTIGRIGRLEGLEDWRTRELEDWRIGGLDNQTLGVLILKLLPLAFACACDMRAIRFDRTESIQGEANYDT